MTETSKAVFLSYASQDAEAAKRISAALRTGKIEVWLDQSELRGGERWDQQIRKQIHECALFIPIISATTQRRVQGYFRREWKLAVDHTHDMSERVAYLVPVIIDDTGEAEADVPEAFRAVQWTRLPAGETPSTFVAHIMQLLSPNRAQTSAPGGPATAAFRTSATNVKVSPRFKLLPLLVAALVLLCIGYGVLYRAVLSKRSGASLTVESSVFAPPVHSIAVLPFVNMSGDKEQEYFSDGLTEELLNSLAQIKDLQVAARTSAFSFKGKDTDIGTIARKLNVGSVLEGSVRRSGQTVRITAQLINAVTGFNVWSHTYDRDLGDVLKLETEIAGAVASGLELSLLGEVATRIELGGTRDPAAFDAYLRGRKAQLTAHSDREVQAAIAAFTEAIERDPTYSLAYANRSLALNLTAGDATGGDSRESYEKAQANALKAIALTPELAEAHVAMAAYFQNGALDFTQASAEHERALALAPGNAQVLQGYGIFAVLMGRTEAGIAATRRAVVLDPLNRDSRAILGLALYWGRQNKEAIDAFQETLALDPEYSLIYARRGLAYYVLGEFGRARESCESKPELWESQVCLAVTYDKLGQRADAASMLTRLQGSAGAGAAYQSAQIYAQWGNATKAFEGLDTAMRVRDPGLELLKADPLMDPLRKDPGFREIMREFNFPN